jgi:hypothetical protein
LASLTGEWAIIPVFPVVDPPAVTETVTRRPRSGSKSSPGVAKVIKDWKKILSEDPIQARFRLVMEMYLQRFPYEDSERDLPEA